MDNETGRQIRTVLDERKDLRDYLFCRGFLITDQELDTANYPFYSNWLMTLIGEYRIYVHHLQKLTLCRSEVRTCFLIGHAYNPYTMESDEQKILQGMTASEDILSILNQLTGIFFLGIIDDNGLTMHVDSSSMQQACYGEINGHLYITSHMRLVGDLLNLQMTDYVHRLVNYRWYQYMMGNYLPGDITCFQELTRMVPNTCVRYHDHTFSIHRFYPDHKIRMCTDEAEYQEVIQEAAQILRNTMALIPQKWDKPAISLTGGIDSNTTFAAANGYYDQYTAFSYVSMHREEVDAEKAEQIAKRFNVPWKRYDVPEESQQIADYEIMKLILDWNDGGIGTYRDNETRKKIYLIQNDICDVEVKSWISETVRAYAYKYFGRTSFPESLCPRNYTSLYKIFLLNRRLKKETDRYFADYLKRTELKEHLYNYDETDIFVWEIMHGGKCGLDIGVMKTCFDITIPYNNRNLLDLLLRVPLEKRISDQLHLDLKKALNPELYDMNIRVVNLNETDNRKMLLNAYYVINSKLPF